MLWRSRRRVDTLPLHRQPNHDPTHPVIRG